MQRMRPATVLDWLVRRYPKAKRQTLKRMVDAGRVRVSGKRATRLAQGIAPDEQVEVVDRVNRTPDRPSKPASLRGIIYEDQDILVIDKPAGLLTSTVPREPRATLLAQVREYIAEQDPSARVGLIHRLDRDASGLLIFSKNDAAYRSLKTQFFHHSVGREYRAVVHGVPQPRKARIQNRLVERADGTVHATRQPGKGELAITDYEVLKTHGKLSLVRVLLRTGRKHQIRSHLAGRGTPVVGDPLYGPDDHAPRLMLAATRLVIQHPRTGSSMTFGTPIPREFPL